MTNKKPASKRKAREAEAEAEASSSEDEHEQGLGVAAQLVGALNPRKQWRPINTQRVMQLLHFFDHDINVRTAYNIRTDALLAGGILFKRKGEKSKPTPEDESWYNNVYAQFCRDLVRMIWAVGFAPCSFVPDEKYVAKPVVLNVELIDIEFRNSALNQPEWAYYERDDDITNTYTRVPMENVITFHLPDCLPTKEGQIRSFMTALLPDIVYEEQLQGFDIVASASRCNPPLVSERVQEIYDVNKVSSTMRREALRQGMDAAAAPSAPTFGTEHSLGDVKNISDTVAMANAYNTPNLSQIEREVQRLAKQKATSGILPQLYLEDNRKYVKHTLAEGPGELVLKAQLQRTERVLTLLGVPMAMLTQSTAVSGKRQLNENSMQLFNNSQRLLKQQLITYMNQMYSMIYTWKHATELVMNSADDEVIDEKVLADATRIEILMPGLPSDHDLHQFWMTGVLKYQAYVKYLSVKHGIPYDQFEPFQKLTVKDLNDIKPENESAK